MDTARTDAQVGLPSGGSSSSRARILVFLKTQGPRTAAMLAEQLELTSMAVRQHLASLQAEGLVQFQIASREQARPGRPAYLWALTTKADEQFPDAHAELATDLLLAAQRELGDAALDRIIDARTDKQVADYEARLPRRRLSLAERVAAVVHLRRQDGFMPDWRSNPDGTLELTENHCATARAAALCPKLCEAEHVLFRRLLGDGVDLRRTESLNRGDRRCVYIIRPTDEVASGQ